MLKFLIQTLLHVFFIFTYKSPEPEPFCCISGTPINLMNKQHPQATVMDDPFSWPPKVTGWLNRALVRETFKKPIVTWEEFQRSTAQVEKSVDRAAISCVHWGKREKKTATFERKEILFVSRTQQMWKNVLWSDENKTELFGLQATCYEFWKMYTAHQAARMVEAKLSENGKDLRLDTWH